MKIKIKEEHISIFLFLLILVSLFAFVTPTSDNYIMYIYAKDFLKNPQMLINGRSCTAYKIEPEIGFCGYTPLSYLPYSFGFLLGLSPDFIDALFLIGIFVLLNKLEKGAFTILLLSFMFLRLMIFGANDIFLTLLTLSCFYFFDKKPKLSAVFAGFCPLVKGVGFLTLGVFYLAKLYKNKANIFKKNFKPIITCLIIPILIITPWYLKNYVISGNIMSAVLGQDTNNLIEGEKWLKTAETQKNQPERGFLDFTGVYPLPVDIFFYLGLFFTIREILIEKKFRVEYVFIGFFALTFFIVHIIDIRFLSAWRYYIPIYPILAIIIHRSIKNKKLINFFYVCLFLVLVYYIFALSIWFNEYTINFLGAESTGDFKVRQNLCRIYLKEVSQEPTFVLGFHNWMNIYECGFNATNLSESKYVIVFEKLLVYNIKKGVMQDFSLNNTEKNMTIEEFMEMAK